MCRACCADGSAIVTTVASRTIMSWAIAITPRALNRLGSGSASDGVGAVRVALIGGLLSLPGRSGYYRNGRSGTIYGTCVPVVKGEVPAGAGPSRRQSGRRGRDRRVCGGARTGRRPPEPHRHPDGGRGRLRQGGARRPRGRDRSARGRRRWHRVPELPDEGGALRGGPRPTHGGARRRGGGAGSRRPPRGRPLHAPAPARGRGEPPSEPRRGDARLRRGGGRGAQGRQGEGRAGR